MLVQPKNDHLLFAYFGISLLIRKRGIKTELRAKLAAKRKAHKALETAEHTPVLLRDPTDDRYPYIELEETKGPIRWKVYRFAGFHHDGLIFTVRKFYAYVDDEGKHWDCVDSLDRGLVHRQENPWAKNEEDDHETNHRVWSYWSDIPEKNKAWRETRGIVLYEDILDIDAIGDIGRIKPHVFVVFDRERGPFRYFMDRVKTIDRYGPRTVFPTESGKERIKYFPNKFPNVAVHVKEPSQDRKK